MSAAKRLSTRPVEQYLADELVSPIKHEYLGGFVYAMAGARNQHNLIAGNGFASLHGGLRGKRCRPYNSDTKIRVRLPTQVRFYYPDVSVICRPNPPTDSFQDEPAVLMEVLSEATRRIDEGEKKEAYFTIPSLHVYLLVETDSPRVTVWRRTADGFVPEVYDQLHAILPMPEIETELPLADLYDGVSFSAPGEE